MKYWILLGVVLALIAGAVTWYWPILVPAVCSTRGCITAGTWEQAISIQTRFAQATNTAAPSRERVLTTLIRQHLIAHATIKSPVKIADAKKYREEVLNLRDAATVEQMTDLTLEQYDVFVILPYLQQEAIRQERRIETPEELFKQLSRERFILVPPLHFWWDKDKAEVVSR